MTDVEGRLTNGGLATLDHPNDLRRLLNIPESHIGNLTFIALLYSKEFLNFSFVN